MIQFPRLYDVSVVSFPAYPDTSADLRSVALDAPPAGDEFLRRRRAAIRARAQARANLAALLTERLSA